MTRRRKYFSHYKKLLTLLFYAVIGLAASSFLAFIFYYSLRINSSITSLIENTAVEPFYLWSYTFLTVGTIILFGIAVALLVYRWRKYGPPRLRQGFGGQATISLGSFFGILASACPVCGSTILSLLGIAGGLAAFPLQGLELKALSFGLMALPVWLTTRELRSLQNCKGESCPVPRDASFKKRDTPWLLFALATFSVFAIVNFDMLQTEQLVASASSQGSSQATGNKTYDEVVAKVLPQKGFKSKIYLGDAVVKLVEKGVIDKDKLGAIYQSRGGLPSELKDIFAKPSKKRITITLENSQIYVNLLWPLGLSNYMATNKESPVNGPSLFNFASTGGWNLGKEENGGAYFNKFKIVLLTAKQEELVTKIAKNTYRPCCNNSTFFQDCNHGSALLGLLQLGAAQGLSEKDLYKEALAFNSFWFPDTYIKTALYFKVLKNTNWDKVNPQEVMGQDFSSIGGWIKNVNSEISKMPNLIPQVSGPGCGV